MSMNMSMKQYIKALIKAYRKEIALWQVKSEAYRNKIEKEKSWKRLLEVALQFDPEANLENVRKKVNVLRASYRRELQKVRNSEMSGACGKDVHTPTLWYFHSLDFLEDSHEEELSTLDVPCQSENPKSSKRPRIKEDEILEKALQHLEAMREQPAIKDEAAIYGEAWATQYRKLEGHQKLYAKKLIDDVLHQGQLHMLNGSSAFYCQPPSMVAPHMMGPSMMAQNMFPQTMVPQQVMPEQVLRPHDASRMKSSPTFSIDSD